MAKAQPNEQAILEKLGLVAIPNQMVCHFRFKTIEVTESVRPHINVVRISTCGKACHEPVSK